MLGQRQGISVRCDLGIIGLHGPLSSWQRMKSGRNVTLKGGGPRSERHRQLDAVDHRRWGVKVLFADEEHPSCGSDDPHPNPSPLAMGHRQHCSQTA